MVAVNKSWLRVRSDTVPSFLMNLPSMPFEAISVDYACYANLLKKYTWGQMHEANQKNLSHVTDVEREVSCIRAYEAHCVANLAEDELELARENNLIGTTPPYEPPFEIVRRKGSKSGVSNLSMFGKQHATSTDKQSSKKIPRPQSLKLA